MNRKSSYFEQTINNKENRSHHACHRVVCKVYHPHPILIPSSSHPHPILIPSSSHPHPHPILIPSSSHLHPILIPSSAHPHPPSSSPILTPHPHPPSSPHPQTKVKIISPFWSACSVINLKFLWINNINIIIELRVIL